MRLLVSMAAALPLVLGACGFFEQLEGTQGTETGGNTDPISDLGTESCGIEDNFCETQDHIKVCNDDTGEITTLNCAILCGSSINLSCLAAGDGTHGCWCVAPGTRKLAGCAEMESCLDDCGSTLLGECGTRCFSRTDATTIRLYGSLVHCAGKACHELCLETPDNCGNCVATAKAGLYGDCSIPRAFCDNDSGDDEDPWPWP